ncbi:hypothetical protein MVEN_01027000 [Mycena venus]|uniref:F-box domain-containing protein n=1 Tax=Mycena venus TaxID=2733690 RepID=A0A8H6YD17_9AGAR|nr:hypothetical protein MVEN_01027000 [Mycena venus]
MHRALQIVEVVEMVCAQVTHFRASRDLACLARTSTIFLDPALNVLWRHQDTIVNILRCMPEDLWVITETRPFDDTPNIIELGITLRRAVAIADWKRFIFYSRRVKSFSIVKQNELLTLGEVNSTGFPRPNLESCSYIHLFLSPHITNLKVRIEDAPNLSILSTVALKCTRLTDFNLGTPFVSPVAAVPPISRFVCSQRSLKSLVAVGLDRAALFHIAQLPGLRYLWLMSDSIPIPTPIPSYRPQPGSLHFPALTELVIETMELAPALLEFMAKCSLVKFKLVCRARSVLYTKTMAKKLGKPPPVLVGEVGMYSSYRSRIRLVSTSTIVSSRTWLVHGPGARIQALLLPPGPSYRMCPRVTLEGVYAFAKYCPYLRVLDMTFDASIVPEINRTTRTTQRCLSRLNAGYSHITKPRPVAKFLSTIFPLLKTISTLHEAKGSITDPQVVASHKGWKKVEEALWDS